MECCSLRTTTFAMADSSTSRSAEQSTAPALSSSTGGPRRSARFPLSQRESEGGLVSRCLAPGLFAASVPPRRSWPSCWARCCSDGATAARWRTWPWSRRDTKQMLRWGGGPKGLARQGAHWVSGRASAASRGMAARRRQAGSGGRWTPMGPAAFICIWWEALHEGCPA
jgi:hypothetical protein